MRCLEEWRNGSNEAIGGNDMDSFNGFIENMELEDIPMVGRKFTWF